jgi:transcriptional regulator with XRE-family HTH domain
MKQSVPASFIANVKYLLKNNAISTRELNQRLGKSVSYITKLLSGQIKTIEYDTAYDIVKILAPNMSNIEEWLIEDIGIEPDSIIQKRFEDAEYESERRMDEIKEAQELVDNIGSLMMDRLIGGEIQFESIDLLMRIAEKDLSFHGSNIYRSVLHLQEEHPKEFRRLSILVDVLERSAEALFWDWDDDRYLSESEKVFRDNAKILLKDGLNESSSGSDTTTKEKKI